MRHGFYTTFKTSCEISNIKLLRGSEEKKVIISNLARNLVGLQQHLILVQIQLRLAKLWEIGSGWKTRRMRVKQG